MFRRLRDIITRSIKNKKLHVFSLFLLFSFLILVLSKLSKSYTEIIELQIQYENTPQNIAIESVDSETLDITLKTYGFNLLSSLFSKKTVTIDFEDHAQQEENAYVFVTERKRTNLVKEFGSNFEIMEINPDTLRVFYSQLATKKVPVVLNSSIEFLPGYDSLKGMIVDPDSVNVIGSQKDIQDITEVQTEILEMKDIKDDITTTIELIYPNGENTFKLSTQDVSVNASVEKFTEGTLDLPVIVTNLPPETQINYFPKSINISFEVSLDNYKSIKPTDFRIECDFTNIKDSQQSFFIPKLKKVPDNVKRVKMKQNKIEYIITQ